MEKGFLFNQTGWAPELVCEHTVPVVCEEKIEDIYEEIMISIEKGDGIFHKYSEDEAYQQFLRDELSERIKDFSLADLKADPRFELYFHSLLAR